jgi:hypothetical protein
MAQLSKGRVSRVEVFIWRGDDAPKRALPVLLKKARLHLRPQPTAETDAGKATLFNSAHQSKKNQVMGLWMEQENAILLAWGIFTPDGAPAADEASEGALGQALRRAGAATPDEDTPEPAPKAARRGGEENTENAPANAIVHNLDADARVVNVMGRVMPRTPAFPRLTPKPGTVRGYVYDSKGRPLKNASLGVRASLFTGAQARTDDKGYYEIVLPLGATQFYNAGYSVDYGEGSVSLGLHPADGEASASAPQGSGAVENFVLLPYGIADRAGAQDDPQYGNNYYGGSLSLIWYADEDPRFPDPKALPPDGTIEITLTPDGLLVDGSPARPIIVRKPVGRSVGLGLYVHNIPVGAYKIAARLVGGGALNLKEIGPAGRSFGISPKNANGTADLLFRPKTSSATMSVVAHGNWEPVKIQLQRP